MDRHGHQFRCLSVVFTLALLLAAGYIRAADPASQRSPRPNFVFFLADDMGWRDAGCYGSTFYETPNIDRLAKQGMRFTIAYAACPVCSPTRASIMTGKYPARLGTTDYFGGPQPDTIQGLHDHSARGVAVRLALGLLLFPGGTMIFSTLTRNLSMKFVALLTVTICLLLPSSSQAAAAGSSNDVAVTVDLATVVNTMRGGIGASWHAIEEPISAFHYPART